MSSITNIAPPTFQSHHSSYLIRVDASIFPEIFYLTPNNRQCVVIYVNMKPWFVVKVDLFPITFPHDSQMGRFKRSVVAGLSNTSGKTSYRKISKPRDSGLDFFNRSEMWQAPRQQRCRDACQISLRYKPYYTQYRGFEKSRDLAVRRLTA